MSFLTSFIESALTPAGTNAANQQNATNQNVQNLEYQDLLSNNPLLQQQMSYASSMEPARESALTSAYMYASPGNSNARQAAYDNSVQSNASTQAAQQNFADRAEGLSSGAQSGDTLNTENQAQGAEDAYAQQQANPEYQYNLAAQQLGTIAQMQSDPALQTNQALAQGIYGAPKVQVQPGFGEILGNALGQYVGGLGGGGGEPTVNNNFGGSDGSSEDSPSITSSLFGSETPSPNDYLYGASSPSLTGPAATATPTAESSDEEQ